MDDTARTSTPNGKSSVPANQVYVIAGVCFVVGLLLGYIVSGKRAMPSVAQGRTPTTASNSAPSYAGGHPKLTLEQMKQMADVQASALLEKSKADPKNVALLNQIAGIYQASHQFKEAAEYLEKALKIEPKNVSARTQLASCLYYSGDADGAVSQLNEVLKENPKDVNALFNLGMIKYQGKNDAAGAIAVWERLLKNNPNLDRKPIVEQLIAEAKASTQPRN
jgi:cytochrome c-type biogenesis protein CcmH/NrfG